MIDTQSSSSDYDDIELLHWVMENYPDMRKVIRKKLWNNIYEISNKKRLNAASIHILGKITKFNIGNYDTLSTCDSRKYRKIVKKLDKHVKSNEDMLLFSLL